MRVPYLKVDLLYATHPDNKPPIKKDKVSKSVQGEEIAELGNTDKVTDDAEMINKVFMYMRRAQIFKCWISWRRNISCSNVYSDEGEFWDEEVLNIDGVRDHFGLSSNMHGSDEGEVLDEDIQVDGISEKSKVPKNVDVDLRGFRNEEICPGVDVERKDLDGCAEGVRSASVDTVMACN